MYAFTSASAETTTVCSASLAVVVLATTSPSRFATLIATSWQLDAAPWYSHDSEHSAFATQVRSVPTSTMAMEHVVGETVGNFVGFGDGFGVGFGVGCTEGSADGFGVGSALGSGVGSGVGSALGSGVGSGVGDTEGENEGFGVGNGVGIGVGAGVYEMSNVALSEAHEPSEQESVNTYELMSALPGTASVCEPSLSTVALCLTTPSLSATDPTTEAQEDPSPW